jgi:hypothetical protein
MGQARAMGCGGYDQINIVQEDRVKSMGVVYRTAGLNHQVLKIGLCQWEAQVMDKLTGHGGNCVNTSAEDRGSVNRVRWPGLSHSDHWTRRGSQQGALDRFKSTGYRGQVKSTECKGQVSKQLVVTRSSQQGAEDMVW